MTVSSSSTRYIIVSAIFLLCVSFALPVQAQTTPRGIQVEMDTEVPYSLRVTIRSGAATPIKLYKDQLPWGSRYSMILVAVTPQGECVEKELFVDDPPIGQVLLEAKGSLNGRIDLQRIFKNLSKPLKKSDVQLFWAYRAPKELEIDEWSGGWILLPRQQH